MSTTSNPLVSIIVCCHNREHYLKKTLDSVLCQQYKPSEVVILDDGSTDHTRELVATYGKRVRYFWQNNQGIAIARTNACRYAEGELIAFVDDDDLMPPDRITILFDVLQKYTSAVMAMGDLAEIDIDGNLTGKRWMPEDVTRQDEAILMDDGCEAVLWPTVPALPHTTLFRKIDGEKIGWFDNQFRNGAEDKDFFARLGELGPIVYVPRVVSFHRVGHTALTNNHAVVAYNQSLLFVKHLRNIGISRKRLRNRLQLRLLVSLKKISFYKRQGLELPCSVRNDYLNRCLSLIGHSGRFAYFWYTLVKLPLRSILLRRTSLQH